MVASPVGIGDALASSKLGKRNHWWVPGSQLDRVSPAARQSQKHAFVVSPADWTKSRGRTCVCKSLLALAVYCAFLSVVETQMAGMVCVDVCLLKCCDSFRSSRSPYTRDVKASGKSKSHRSKVFVTFATGKPRSTMTSKAQSFSSMGTSACGSSSGAMLSCRQCSMHRSTEGPQAARALAMSSSGYPCSCNSAGVACSAVDALEAGTRDVALPLSSATSLAFLLGQKDPTIAHRPIMDLHPVRRSAQAFTLSDTGATPLLHNIASRSCSSAALACRCSVSFKLRSKWA